MRTPIVTPGIFRASAFAAMASSAGMVKEAVGNGAALRVSVWGESDESEDEGENGAHGDQ